MYLINGKTERNEVVNMDLEDYDYVEGYEDVYDGLEAYEEDDVMESMVTQTRGSTLSGRNTPTSSSTYTRTSTSNPFGFMNDMNAGVVIAVPIISLIITILVFVLVVEKKKAPRNGFVRWLREFLNFRSILISGIIKFVYLFLAVALTISSFVVMAQGGSDSVLEAILAGLAMLIFGNILLRIMMEMTMIMIGLWKNTSDMRAVIVRDDERSEEKKPEEKAPQETEEPKVPETPLESQIVEETTVTEISQEPQVTEEPTITEMPQESQSVAQQ